MMVRTIGGFVVGLFVLGVVVMTLQQLSSELHPLPEGVDPMDRANAEAFAAHLAAMPAAAWGIAFLSELLGAFLGALAGAWIAADRAKVVSGLLVGVALLGSLANWTSFAHPVWFMAGQIVGYPVALMAVWAIVQKKRPPAGAEGRSG